MENSTQQQSFVDIPTKNSYFHKRGFSSSRTSPFTRSDIARNTCQQAAMISIYNGCKKSDVSIILGKTKNVLPQIKSTTSNQQNETQIYDEKQEQHDNLVSLRQQCDDFRTKEIKLQQELKALKEENDKLKEKEQVYSTSEQDLKMQEQDLMQQKDDAKLQMEEFVWQLKSYLHMRERLKADQISYSIRKNELKEQIDNSTQQLNTVQIYTKQSQQFQQQTQYVFDEMIKNIELEHNERETQLNSFKEQIKNHHDLDKQREERAYKQIQIAEHAMNDKDPNEKKWKKLLYVHIFISQMLKDKMEREMKKFEIVEQAFQKIKQTTGVSDAQEIVNKFLSREQTYGELLSSIADQEKKIVTLKKSHDKLTYQLDELKQELVTMESLQKKTKTENNETEIYAMDEKSKKAQLMKEKFYQWCIKIMIKHDKVQKLDQNQNKKNYYEKYPRKNIIEAFKAICQRILAILNNSKEEEIQRVLDSINAQNAYDETKTEEFLRKNIRIKPSQNQSSYKKEQAYHSRDSSKDSKTSSNTVSNSNVESDSETPQIDDENENDYTKNLREELKKEQDVLQAKIKIEEEKKKMVYNYQNNNESPSKKQ